MAHSVRITQRAFEQIDAAAEYIALDSIEAARRWRDRLLLDIESLHHFPLRHGLAPEAEAIGAQVRQMMHGVYRILYTVDENVVTIHGIRHGARRPLRPDELPRQE
ncbi:MAG: type II toxin-antitoxin system RelE/ParE family toxin [Pirellulales bacterium]